jgi:hypothetical protein
MGSPTDCVTKGPTTVGGIEATIVAGAEEATTAGLVPQTAGQDLPIVGRVMAEVTTAVQAAAVIILAVAVETMSVM